MNDYLTPLHQAACNGHLKVCEFILLNLVEKHFFFLKNYNKPTHSATQSGHWKTWKLIAKYFQDNNRSGNNRITPPHLAAQYGRHLVTYKVIM